MLDINLHPKYLETIDATYELTDPKKILTYLKTRKKFSHKGTYGHALILAGSKGKMGAAVLAARACLRSGTGLLTMHIPEAGLSILQTTVPEAMCTISLNKTDHSKFSAIGIGPGLGTSEEQKNLLQSILNNYSRPMVLDADALNILSAHRSLFDHIPAGSILTPHPKEFERLCGPAENDLERIEMALRFSVRYPFVIILKGHYTLTAFAGKGYFNTTGNSGMAKGGSGDALTGILTALLAQGYHSEKAAILGVYLHGLAADLSLLSQSQTSMIASDLIENLGMAFYELADQGNS